jgi:uncharacterized tellurite resistance protein B-like protein
MAERRLQIKLNSNEKIEQLLQESYDLTCKQINDIQNEMNKLSNSCNLGDSTIEEKTKYAKAINDFIGSREKAITKKFEIAKLMAEIVKHNGDINETLNDKNSMKGISGFNVEDLKKAMREQMNNNIETYQLKR